MADMQELIARLEAAEAGCRELDAAIADELDPIENQHDGYPGRWPFAEGSPLSLRTPAVTTSLDAALALAERVFPGWAVEVSRINAGTSRCTANIWTPAQRGALIGSGRVFVDATTPALALCIAILKAKARGEGG